MQLDFSFAPQLPLWLILAIVIPTGALAAWGVAQGLRGSWVRAAAWVLLALALFNPALLIEDREKLRSVVAIVTDESGSSKLDGRAEQTKAIRDALVERFGRLDAFELREVAAGDLVTQTTDVSTALFRALGSALQDVPPDRVAGAVLVTDGQVHDVPQSLAAIGIDAPVHALVTGREGERDRRVVIEQAPRFGVVGEPYQIDYRIVESGFGEASSSRRVSIFLDGELIAEEEAGANQTLSFAAEVAHGGKNIIELRVETADGEITDVNNRAFVTLNGIRENLRVLLVSGEPHPGERTWRNLLKSDPSVDLVHFTILRPPEKQDGTPINQLSLIAFPTRELFVQKIDEFDLIIFDRYRRRGILPLLYFENIARYVRDGGALLISAGPEFGEESSVAQPLSDVLPVQPDGTVLEEPFTPMISQTGLKHPVTRGLDGWRNGEPNWGRWFRSIGAVPGDGQVVMSGKDETPLLVLNRAGEGRVALFLSDHPWLWARGFEGGGPHVQMLRRASHWLMKEPELDEERLSATSDGREITIERQTLGDKPDDAVLRDPAGVEKTIPFVESQPGLWRAVAEVDAFGLYSVSNGDLTALTHVGPPNPREYGEVLSTTGLLSGVLEEARGSARRVDPASPRGGGARGRAFDRPSAPQDQ